MTALPRAPRQTGVPASLRDHARHALSQGWAISIAGSGHLRWRSPDGKTTVFTPRMPWKGRCEVTVSRLPAGLAAGGPSGAEAAEAERVLAAMLPLAAPVPVPPL